MDNPVVGDSGLSFLDVSKVLRFSEGSEIRLSNIVDLARELGNPPETINRIQHDHNVQMMSYNELILSVLTNWKAKFSSQATLQRLLEAIRNIRLVNTADNLKRQWIQILVAQHPKLDWDNLGESFQNDLKPRLVKIQDQTVTLEYVLTKLDLKPENTIELEQDLLIRLLNDTIPSIVSSMVPPISTYNISRKITSRKILQSSQIFSDDNSKDVFLFTGIERHELTVRAKRQPTDKSSNQRNLREPTNRYIIMELKSDFVTISQKTTKPVHWVHHDNGKFQWVRSSGSIEKIQFSLDNSTNSEYERTEDEFIEELNKDGFPCNIPVCISDAPGMGKSLLLANLARIIHQNFSERIIILLDFATLVSKLKECLETSLSFKDQLLSTLSSFASTSKLGTRFLLQALKSETMNVEVMLDGLDEVPSENQVMAKHCLLILTCLPSLRVWVTTRPHLLLELEKSLTVLGNNIIPFTSQDQHHFLTRFWCPSTTTSSFRSRLASFATDFLEKIKKSMNNKERDIVGIPLQCMFIATIYEDDAHNFAKVENLTSENSPLSINLGSITGLFRRMIEFKMNLYFTRYGSQNFTKEQIIDAHIYYSLKLLFPETLQHFKADDPVDSKLIFQELLKVGLLEQQPSENGPHIFLHRLFAEYFVALYAHCLMKHEGQNSAKLNFILHLIFENVEKMDDLKCIHFRVNSYTFKHVAICHFIDSMIDSLNLASILFRPNLKIVHSCVTGDLPHLFEVISNTDVYVINNKFVFDLELLIVAAKYACVNLISKVLEKYEKIRNCKVMNHVLYALLNVAVMFRDYSVVEHLTNHEGLRELIRDSRQKCTEVLEWCVRHSSGQSQTEIQEKIDIIRLLVRINRGFLKRLSLYNILKDSHGYASINIHHLLQVELIRQGANVCMKKGQHENILKTWTRKFTQQEWKLCFRIVPPEIFKQLAMHRERSGECALVELLRYFDPDEDILQMFQNAGVIQEFGVNLIEAAIRGKRTVHTLEELIKRGNIKITTSDECSLVIDAIVGDNFSAFQHFALIRNNKPNIRQILRAAVDWVDLKKLDLRTLNLDLNPNYSIFSLIQNVLESWSARNKQIIIEILINSGAEVKNIELKDSMYGVDLAILKNLETNGAISSTVKAFSFLRYMIKHFEFASNSQSFALFSRILSKWRLKIHEKYDGTKSLMGYAIDRPSDIIYKFIQLHGKELDEPAQFEDPSSYLRSAHERFLLPFLSEFVDNGQINTVQLAYMALEKIVKHLSPDNFKTLIHVASKILKKMGHTTMIEHITDENYTFLSVFGTPEISCEQYLLFHSFFGVTDIVLSLDIIALFENQGAISSPQLAFRALKNIIKLKDFDEAREMISMADKIIKKCGKCRVLDQRGKIGDSLLHIACLKKNLHFVKYFLDMGIDPNGMNKRNETPLHCALYSWQNDEQGQLVEIVHLLIKFKVDLIIRDDKNFTALHLAIADRRFEMVLKLLDTEAFDDLSEEMLEHTTKFGDILTFQFMRNWHTNLLKKSKSMEGFVSNEKLLNAAAAGKNLGIFEYLLERDDGLCFQTNLKDLVCMCLEREHYFEGESRRFLRFLCSRIPSLLDKPNLDGEMPLLLHTFDADLTYWMLQNIDNARVVDNENRNIAFLAAEYFTVDQYLGLVRRLINYGYKDLLLAKGGDKDATVLHQVVLIDGFPTTSGIMSSSDTCPSMQSVLEKFKLAGADFNAADNNGNSVLMYAMMNTDNSRWFFNELISQGASVSQTNNQDTTVLHIACAQQNKDFVQLLIEKCDVKAKDTDGNTPLHFFISSERNYQNYYSGRTLQIVDAFLRKGFSRYALNNEGLCPYDIAIIKNAHKHVVDKLKP